MTPTETHDGQWSPTDGYIGGRSSRHECRFADPGRGECGCEDDGSTALNPPASVDRRRQ